MLSGMVWNPLVVHSVLSRFKLLHRDIVSIAILVYTYTHCVYPCLVFCDDRNAAIRYSLEGGWLFMDNLLIRVEL